MINFMDPKLSPKVTTTAAALDDYEASNLTSEDFRTRARGFLAYTSIKPPVDIHFEFLCNVQIRYITLQTTLGSQKTIGIEVLAGDAQASLGKQFYDDREPERGLIMCDSKYYNKQNPPTQEYKSYRVGYFARYQHPIFTNTNKLCVRILRTDMRSVPCLGQVEVWGYTAKSVSGETKRTIYKIMNKTCELNEDENLSSIRSIVSREEKREFTIPDEFKDALTFDVMSQPMTLPSGNNIDKVTLEKCIHNDATYGRNAADPFTGMEFLPNRKPVFNAALKNRIDMFLLQHGDQKEVKSAGRTLGTSFKSKGNLRTNYGDKYNRQTNYSSKLTVEVPAKRQKLATAEEGKSSSSNSLEDAILRAKNSGGFMCFTSVASNEQNGVAEEPTACSKCKCAINLYKISNCGHIFCRGCLLPLKNVCHTCRVKFANADVRKVDGS